MDPADVIEIVRQARLRGRGGAGFPTAVKWQGVYSSPASRKFICCNGAEGEPGTFKDRLLLRKNPYQALEGLAIGAYALGAERAYFCVKERAVPEAEAVRRALAEFQAETRIGDKIEIVLGPDEYLFGEEKALLEVIEGGLPLPRRFPPREHGLFGGADGGPSEEDNNPTAVNNVETLSHVPHIINKGPEWFRGFGTDDTPGTMVFTISGDVQQPVVRELPLGMTLRALIFEVAGGLKPGRRVKAVLPGVAGNVITEDMLDIPLGFDSMRRAGSSLGAGGYVVYDDTACMVKVLETLSHFLYVESCNQCPPCKIGSRRITGHLERLLAGDDSVHVHDIDDIHYTTSWVENAQRCYLPTSEALVSYSILEAFRSEFLGHLPGRTCPLRHDLLVPKMTDYVEGQGFTYDLGYLRKQPDWSYATRR
jgi:NADH:ubiquinone oxidoreductase subunit F (NADH-binding)